MWWGSPSDTVWTLLVCLARHRMEMEIQSHSDADRIWYGIETLQYYRVHHTAGTEINPRDECLKEPLNLIS